MKQLLVLLLLLYSASVSAQDVIVKKDGSTVVCRVVEVTSTEITYKKWSDLNGSTIIMDKSLAAAINYESGKKETFSQTESLYKPNNQNDGEQAMNDKALLRLDYAASNPYKKVKALKKTAIIGGGILVGSGIISIILANTGMDGKGASHPKYFYSTAAGLIVGGGLWYLGFNMAANHTKKKIDEKLSVSSLYQYDIPCPNGSSLSLGADMLSDRTLGTNTVGLGLRYNL